MKIFLIYFSHIFFLAMPQVSRAKSCHPPNPPATTKQINSWLHCTLGEIQTVWSRDITRGILLSYPRFRSVKELELTFVSDCDFSPRLEDIDNDGRDEIVFNTRLLIPQMMVSQAILWYVIAPDQQATPSEHLIYLNEVLLPAVRQDSRLCSRSGAVGRFNAVDIPSFFYTHADDYRVFLQLNSPRTQLIGDYVGALPSFFAMIHEAGHAALHINNVDSFGLKKEIEADNFAAVVFDANKVQLTLGLAYLLLAYDLDRGGTSSDIACRIVELADRRNQRDGDMSSEIDLQTAERIEALRKEYVSFYSRLCLNP